MVRNPVVQKCLMAACAVMLLASCAEGAGSSATSEEGGVEIELGSGETQDEQIAELETFVQSMRDYLGQDYRLRDDSGAHVDVDEWSPEFHRENRPPVRSCEGDDYRHGLAFDYLELNAESAYEDARKLAQGLGFEPNDAVNNDGSDGQRMNFTATGEDGRTLIVRQQRGDGSVIEVFYRARCSDHQTLQDVATEHLEEYKDELRQNRNTQ